MYLYIAKPYDYLMQLSKIREIRETYGEKKTNELFSKGYELIRILQTKKTTGSDEITRPMYILGKN